MTTWRMRIACWISKATNTQSEYLTLIVLPPAAMVKRTCLNVMLYVHCLSCRLSFFFLFSLSKICDQFALAYLS